MTTSTTITPTTNVYNTALFRAVNNGLLFRGVSENSVDHIVRYYIENPQTRHEHVVRLSPNSDHLVCDCAAAEYGSYCQHRAFVHAFIIFRQGEKAALSTCVARYNSLVRNAKAQGTK